jgi:CHAT domain-containing protein/lipoprotein NlpI
LSDESYFEEFDLIENELMDQYVHDSIAADGREKLERRLLRGERQQQKLAFVKALDAESSARATAKEKLPQLVPRSARSSFSTAYLKVAAGVIVAVGLGLVVWALLGRKSDVDRGMIALNRAHTTERLVQSRISELNYAPARQLRGNEQGTMDRPARDYAERLFLDAVNQKGDAASYHALGRLYLAQRDFDKAREQFEKALAQNPNDARVHSDLGAALLEEGKSSGPGAEQNNAVEEFDRSLEHLDKALELDTSLLEAIFNRALLYEQMMLPQRAEDDWRRYLKMDPNSQWASEAAHHLKQLEERKNDKSENREQLYQKFLTDYGARDEEGVWRDITLSNSRVGNYIFEKLVDAYLNSAGKGQRADTENTRRMLLYVAAAKARRAGDLYASALTRFYQSVPYDRIPALSRARNLMKAGQQQVSSAQFSQALKSHAEARQLFNNARDGPEAQVAEYWLAVCYQQLNDKERSATIFDKLVQACERDNYRWLLVRSLNGLATHEALLGQFSKAIRYSLRSREIAEQTSEAYGEISALSFLMQAYLYLGNRQESLSHVRRLLSSAFSSMEIKQQWVTYNEVAWTLSSLGLDAAAPDYQKVALRLAQQLQDPSAVSLSFVRLGVMYGKVANYEGAFSNIQQAFKMLEAHSSEPFAQQIIAYASLQQGNLYEQAGQLEQAISSFNSCIELYSNLNLPAFVYQARKGKLLSLIASNDISAAKEELKTTLSLYEEYRSTIVEESNRNSFFDLEHDVFDVAVDFEYSTLGNPERAFEYSEHSRARSLLALTLTAPQLSHESYGPELVTRKDSKYLSLSELQNRLPERVQIVQYAVLKKRVLIWVVSKRGFHSHATEIEANGLKKKIEDYLRFIQNRDQDQTLREAKELYSILIQPVESFLEKDKQIYIVPDKILIYLPFSTLISPASQRYLIQDYLLAMSPSSNIFLTCTRSAEEKRHASEEKLLGVGNPTFDHQEFPDLPELPSSGDEVNKAAAFYEQRSIFVAKEATRENIVREMREADVIHLASHSITDERSPLRSKLILAKKPLSHAETMSDNGVLQASEIYELDFPRTTLVVLSACQTGSGPSFRGEGMMSMARPFLARAVPMVVASLWEVDSDATAELIINFHRYRKRGGCSTIEALRRAQLDMLNGPRELYRDPYYWAPFNLIGGYAEI